MNNERVIHPKMQLNGGGGFYIHFVLAGTKLVVTLHDFVPDFSLF